VAGAVTHRLFSCAPLARIAVLRVVVYLFVPVDVLLTTTWVRGHAQVPGELYVPLRLGRLLPLPTPGPWVEVFQVVLVLAAVAATVAAVRDRLPRVTGWLVAVLYLEWMVVAMSYGKVDHDRFAFLVALFVLPSVGRAGLRSNRRTEAAGWAVSMIALAVVATYVLAGVAKIRFGGWDWVDGATLTRALVRRNTPLSEPLLDHTWVLHAAQYAIIVMELLVAPLLLVRWRDRRVTWGLTAGFLGFHLLTFSLITIIFLPHCVALLALLPLERLVRRRDPVAPRTGRWSEAGGRARTSTSAPEGVVASAWSCRSASGSQGGG